jgi:hypothetical protein
MIVVGVGTGRVCGVGVDVVMAVVIYIHIHKEFPYGTHLLHMGIVILSILRLAEDVVLVWGYLSK